MKIKKKNTTIPINGKIVDTENVEDKTSNAPSLRLAEKIYIQQKRKLLVLGLMESHSIERQL